MKKKQPDGIVSPLRDWTATARAEINNYAAYAGLTPSSARAKVIAAFEAEDRDLFEGPLAVEMRIAQIARSMRDAVILAANPTPNEFTS